MITLDEKIKSINEFNKAMLKSNIAELENMINGNNEILQPAQKGIKKEFKNVLQDTYLKLDYYKIYNLQVEDDIGNQYKITTDFDMVDGILHILKGGIKNGANITVAFDARKYRYKEISVGFMHIMHHDKTRDELIRLKREAEAKLNDTKIMHEVGYPYFDDVHYLDNDQLRDFEKEKSKTYFSKCDHSIFFMAANYLMYLHLFIQHLKDTQKNCKRNRATAPPAEEIISILKYIEHEHEATAPLIKLLATFEGDYSGKIKSYYNRIAYKIEKETAQITPPPALNKDKLSELKIEYKEKIKDFYHLMKNHNPRNYKKPTETLLLELNLPIKPSDI